MNLINNVSFNIEQTSNKCSMKDLNRHEPIPLENLTSHKLEVQVYLAWQRITEVLIKLCEVSQSYMYLHVLLVCKLALTGFFMIGLLACYFLLSMTKIPLMFHDY